MCSIFFPLENKNKNKKHCKNREKLHQEHLIGQSVKLFFTKKITFTITTVTTANVTTVTITIAKIRVF